MHELQKLINKCIKTNNAYQEAQAALNKYCIEHYGYQPCDVDCDYIIDTCFGGCGVSSNITADEFDQELKKSIERNG